MILPTKYVKVSNSLLNVGAILLSNITEPKTVTELWTVTKEFDEVRTFDKFTLGLDFLYVLGSVEFYEGMIRKTAK